MNLPIQQPLLLIPTPFTLRTNMATRRFRMSAICDDSVDYRRGLKCGRNSPTRSQGVHIGEICGIRRMSKVQRDEVSRMSVLLAVGCWGFR